MAKIVLGVPFDKGLRNDVTAFNIDKNSFPTLINAYQWRGRIKRKRGTELLTRLKRYLNGLTIGTTDGSGSLTVNLLSGGTFIPAAQQSFASIVFNSINFTDGTNIWTEPTAPDGTLLINGVAGGGSINYASGAVVLNGGLITTAVTGSFSYYPGLPGLGWEDFEDPRFDYAVSVAFDNTYSYTVQNVFPYFTYDVGFYKNPASSGTYVAKSTWTRTSWNGQTYQQYWAVNYQGAIFVTNGVTEPFTTTNIGMQFKNIVTVTVITPTTATLQITGHGLVVGDFVFVNEVATTTGINFQTGYVTTVTDVNNVIVTFPNATVAANGTGGIAQYLTSRADPTKDCLRWYDGDPTNGSLSGPVPSTTKGWVNFMPPLSQASFTVGELPQAQYYLVGARIIQVYKDRLVFFGPVVQTAGGNPIYLQDQIIYSQNGTPFYTASFTGDPSATTTVFNPLLVPDNQTATATAFWEDQTGFGGFVNTGLNQAIKSVSTNRDVLIVGFDNNVQSKLVFTGNDIFPFAFYTINSEYGTSSTFSVINLDKGVLSRGNRAFVMTGQEDAGRFDLEIPDEVFQIGLQNNGSERFTAVRDYINEWVCFTYINNQSRNSLYFYPNQTLFYNYRDRSWAIFRENYTHYGSFRKRTGFTWATVGLVYPTWSVWNQPWNAGSNTLLQAQTVGLNQQGFVLITGVGTGEGASLQIKDIASSTVTCPDHGLNQGDYFFISGALGTIGNEVNGKIFSVNTLTRNSFTLNPSIGTGTYLGGGVIKRIYKPDIRSAQLPVHWELANKTRIGVQRYLFTATDRSQVTLYLYLSQNSASPYNFGPIVPELAPDNSGLIYSTVLYTCPESTNIGLTPANKNLMTPGGLQQDQIWHRLNTSLIGDTVQFGITLSDQQLRLLDSNGQPINQYAEIELHGAILDVYPSQMLI
jgi:hypothetical protein